MVSCILFGKSFLDILKLDNRRYFILPTILTLIIIYVNYQLNFGMNVSSHYLSEVRFKIHKSQIRHHIWMLWDKGIENAPLHVKQCYQSWVVKNPDHCVKILNLKEAETLINRNDIIDNTTWSTMSIQAKSDVIRAFLLWKFGGIWVDATVLCLKPLNDWMNYTQPFVTFIRHDGGTNCKKCKNGKLIGKHLL